MAEDALAALLEHEHHFHLAADQHTGPRHTLDTARLVVGLLRARALAWVLDRWPDRWLLAGLLTDPTAGTALR